MEHVSPDTGLAPRPTAGAEYRAATILPPGRRRRRRPRTATAVAGIMVIAAAVAVMAEGPRPLRWRRARRASAGASSASAAPSRLPTAAWVVAENAKPGSTGWTLPPGRRRAGIEGYAEAVSVARGGSVGLHVSTDADTFRVEAYRMGYYGGAGGRLVWSSPPLTGERGEPPKVDPRTHMVEAMWPLSLRISTGGAWPPGLYLLKLIGDGGQQSYVPLTIRDDSSTAAYVIQNSVTTWQAYNMWGGYDLYEGRSGRGTDFAHRSRVVSFDRPYLLGDGAGDIGNELPLITHAESLGLDVTYWTDVDLDQHPERLLRHRALVSLGHDEYWSSRMRDGAALARDRGVNLVFLGANAVFRHIRLLPSLLGDARREVDYKSAREDPLRGIDDAEVTVDWRDPPTSRPESSLIGDMYECNPVKADMVVVDAANWVFAGSGLHDGDKLADLVGPEYDRFDPRLPAPGPVRLLAHSPLRCSGKSSFSDMTYTTAASGAGVFATGTNWWVSRLAARCKEDPCVAKAVARVTDNVLAAFGFGPAGLLHPAVSNYASLPHTSVAPRSHVEQKVPVTRPGPVRRSTTSTTTRSASSTTVGSTTTTTVPHQGVGTVPSPVH